MTLNNTVNIPMPGSPRFESDTAKAIGRIRDSLGPHGLPSFGAITLQNLTASRLIATDADKTTESIDLVNWVAGTTNRVTVADDGDGSITLSGPQDIHTGASPTFTQLGIGTTPGYPLEVVGVGLFTDPGGYMWIYPSAGLWIAQRAHSDSQGCTATRFQRSRGTMASPTTVLDDDWITKWQFHQHNGSAWEELGGMLYDVPDVSGDRGRFNFYSGAIGSGVILSIDKLTTKIGDADGTAFVEIDSVTGQFDLHGTARVTKSIWLNPGGIRAPGAKPATFIEYGLTGAWQFADAIEANQESVSGTLKISADMDITVAPTFHIGWSANGVSPGNCEWQLEYLWISPNEATNAAAQETLIVTAAASSTSEGFTFSTITGVDVPTATDKAMLWRITRKSGHANDTIADTVELRGCALTYTSNKLGTAT